MQLTRSFLEYMESTRYTMFYRLGSHPLPMGLIFPHVTCLTLVHCSRNAVNRLIHPRLFPSLQRIRYLSGHPGDVLIHRRFHCGVEWVFPDASYAFYDSMVEAGRGRKDPFLVMSTIVRGYTYDCQRVYDLFMPERGIVSGEWYRSQQHAFFQKKHAESVGVEVSISEDPYMDELPKKGTDKTYLDPHVLYYQNRLEHDFMKNVLDDSLVEGQR